MTVNVNYSQETNRKIIACITQSTNEIISKHKVFQKDCIVKYVYISIVISKESPQNVEPEKPNQEYKASIAKQIFIHCNLIF